VKCWSTAFPHDVSDGQNQLMNNHIIDNMLLTPCHMCF